MSEEKHLGLGVLISMMGGNERTVKAHKAAMGKVIKSVILNPRKGNGGALMMRFEDGTGIKVYDDGQSCCEDRYITTDDKLSDFVGATFIDMELREAPSRACEYGDHEVQFLLVNTNLGTFTLETHNEHNGYYAGFWIVIRELQ